MTAVRQSMRALCLLILSLMLISGWSDDALARRVALVIGNSAYVHATPLPNPANDAMAMASVLRELDFEVMEGRDLDRAATRALLAEFAAALEGAEAGLFFYAGHGIQVGGTNYVVPVDAELAREADVYLALVSLDDVLRVMETQVPTRLVLLDACRDNPLARTLKRSMGATRSTAVGQGLARVDTAAGTLIAYATAPGDVAEDGEGANSPFTAALLENLRSPGLEARQVLSRVRQSVYQATDGRQLPWDSSSLMGDFYFTLNVDVTVPPQAETAPAASQAAELLYWESVKDSGDAAELQSYIDRYGQQGLYFPLAVARLTGLGRQQGAPAEALALDRGRWREVQEALAALGFDPKGVDGQPGRNTFSAIERWQDESDLADRPFDLALVEKLLAAAAARIAASPRRQPAPGSVIKDCDDCPEMVVVPPGSVTMGASFGDTGYELDEGPKTRVTIAKPFAMGRYEVQRREYRKFVEATGHVSQAGCAVWLVFRIIDQSMNWQRNNASSREDDPVNCVSVEDADAYAAWLSRMTGKTYRLPSEAEFYYAEAAGSSDDYPWGMTDTDACLHGNIYDRKGAAALPLLPYAKIDCDDGHGLVAPSGSYRANAFGLHDMVGNLIEYLGDCYHGNLDGLPTDGSLWRDSGDCSRVPIKGSTYLAPHTGLQTADRWVATRVDDGYEWQGFRVLREIED